MNYANFLDMVIIVIFLLKFNSGYFDDAEDIFVIDKVTIWLSLHVRC
jgi:hypothetical protein